MNPPDISIEGSLGFYAIHGCTPTGLQWICANVGDAPAYSDSTRMTQDIADGAHGEGLTVHVNGILYCGDGTVAA